jgi:hypothetical protein
MAAVPAPGGAFALNPADIPGAVFVDYTTVEGRKAYDRAIDPLVPQYQGDPKGLMLFLHNMKTKAQINGWNTILTIPVGAPAVNRSLLTQYGLISLEDVRAHALTYIGQNVKASQDSNNLKLFLDKSLAPDIMMRLIGQGNEYTVGGVEDGPAMLRVLLSLVSIETRAIISVIHGNLRALPTKMLEFNSNILKFNEYVQTQVSELTARGTVANDLMSSLLEAYQSAEEPTFAQYIQQKESQFEDGTIADLTAEVLMSAAEAKYRTMLVKGKWQVPVTVLDGGTSKKDENIIALTTIIKKLTEQHGKAKGKGKEKRDQFSGPWAWKAVAPTGDQPRTFKFRGKDYVACPNHPPAQWALAEGHAGGCRLDKPGGVAQMPAKKPGNAKGLSYVKALLSVLDENEDEGDEDDVEDADEENV